ncbi:MAG: class I SAM-dependent methyltransferase [Bdellovibrionales bacterium]|nr:class I SAM-dependent methyltransferase [Bdellovibrionales bacterium]
MDLEDDEAIFDDLHFWEAIEEEELFRLISAESNRATVIESLRLLTPDPLWTERIIKFVENGSVETRCVLSWLAFHLKPRNYLEIGVRRGFSMAVVARQSPKVKIYGFDKWVRRYGGVANPGSDFVRSELLKVGFRNQVQFFCGDSHCLLPLFFGKRKPNLLERIKYRHKFRNRPCEFDLMTVDGDHSLLGAYQDLSDVMPHCRIGGVVVFDDIVPPDPTRDALGELGDDPEGWGTLLGVWKEIKLKFPNFRYFEYLREPPGVGLAVRLR